MQFDIYSGNHLVNCLCGVSDYARLYINHSKNIFYNNVEAEI